MSTGVSNDRAAWLAEHVLPHEPALRSWLCKRFASHMDVDDVVQETYALIASLEGVSHIGQPRAYLFMTARSVILQQVRRARIVPIEAVAEIEALDVERDEASPERHAIAGQELRRLAEAMRMMPDKCRRIFLLRRVEGFSQREIAARLGISENTVEKHIGKGLRILAEQMKRGGADATVSGSWQGTAYGGDERKKKN